MLVPHEPEEDPRITWVTQLCAEVSSTDVIGYIDVVGEKPTRSYDGIVFVDRCYPGRHSRLWRILWFFFVRLPSFFFRKLPNFIYRLWRSPVPTMSGSPRFLNGVRFVVKISGLGKAFLAQLETHAPVTRAARHRFLSDEGADQAQSLGFAWAIRHIVESMQLFYVIFKTLYERARSSSLAPSVIICHDLYALLAGVKLKKIFGCPILYDSHELWPEAFLEAPKWEGKIIAFLEQRAIRHADAVITVTPQIARHLEHLYGLRDVCAVPNAEPLVNGVVPSCHRPLSFPLQFVLQGRVVPGRGTEELMEAWRHLRDHRAALIIRSKDNSYFAHLRSRYRDVIKEGFIVIADPVGESELVMAASSADVGIIPYRGPSLCHVYACPNKLSQYMQAGLAILCNVDLQFVGGIVTQRNCGVIYDAARSESLVEAVQDLVNNPDRLQSMKHRAYEYARSEFNWEEQSHRYKALIRELYQRGKGVHE